METIAFLVAAAFLAGLVDAVVGGGGLIQLPALLVALPQAAPIQLLATNKLSSIAGTTTSTITYFRRVRPDPVTAAWLAGAAFLGSAGGAMAASGVPRSAFNPIVLLALIAVGAYILVKPEVGSSQQLRYEGRGLRAAAAISGLAIGFYDGILGPGTGSFLVFALVGWLGYGFLEASAKAKAANFATNLAALVIFVPQGAVLWGLGIAMAVANLVGGYVGARVAVAKGVGFIRAVFIVVVAGFTIKIGWDVWQQWRP